LPKEIPRGQELCHTKELNDTPLKIQQIQSQPSIVERIKQKQNENTAVKILLVVYTKME